MKNVIISLPDDLFEKYIDYNLMVEPSARLDINVLTVETLKSVFSLIESRHKLTHNKLKELSKL